MQDHQHTIGEVFNLQEQLDNKAGKSHTHSGYAPKEHSHDYAPKTHTHSGYAAKSHSHNYAAPDHTHDYAPADHTHPELDNAKHEHDIVDVKGLVSALSRKAELSHTHEIPEVSYIEKDGAFVPEKQLPVRGFYTGFLRKANGEELPVVTEIYNEKTVYVYSKRIMIMHLKDGVLVKDSGVTI